MPFRTRYVCNCEELQLASLDKSIRFNNSITTPLLKITQRALHPRPFPNITKTSQFTCLALKGYHQCF